MKKLLLVALLGLTSIGISANKPDNPIDSTLDKVTQLIPDSAALTYREVYSDIKSGLTALGESLKVGSEHVYEILVKQQVVEATIFVIILLAGILLLIYFYSCFSSKNRYKKDYHNIRIDNTNDYRKEYFDKLDEWNEPHVTKTVISGLLSAFLLIVGIINMSTILTGIINPEYGAIKEILEIIK